MRPRPRAFTERVAIGNLRPLLWTDWRGHLQAVDHDCLATELDAELAAMTGPLTGRARQIAWYLSAELLIDEDHSRLAPIDKGDKAEERSKALQKSLVQLLSDLIGLRVESTAVDWDPDNEELLRVYSPKTVVGFWLDPECWYNGWPDSGVGEQRVHDLASRGHAADRHEHRRPRRPTSRRGSPTAPGHLEGTLPTSAAAFSAAGAGVSLATPLGPQLSGGARPADAGAGPSMTAPW